MIENVIGEYSKEQLVGLLHTTKFSIIADRGTDTSRVKHLCLVTRVVNDNTI